MARARGSGRRTRRPSTSSGAALDLLPAALPPGPDRDRIELEIKVSLGISLQATLGFAAPEVGDVHARARELCRTVEGGPLLLGALGGLFLYYYFRSDFGAAREMAEQHLQVTEIIGARNRLCASYSALGYTAFQIGALAEARSHFERSIELIDTYPRPEGTALTPNNIGVASQSMLALTWCVLGRREAAVAAIESALGRAERCPSGERAFSTAYALTCASRLRLMMAEPLEARRCAQEAMRIGREHGFALHVGAGALADCAARIALGEAAADEPGRRSCRVAGPRSRPRCALLARSHRGGTAGRRPFRRGARDPRRGDRPDDSGTASGSTRPSSAACAAS